MTTTPNATTETETSERSLHAEKGRHPPVARVHNQACNGPGHALPIVQHCIQRRPFVVFQPCWGTHGSLSKLITVCQTTPKITSCVVGPYSSCPNNPCRGDFWVIFRTAPVLQPSPLPSTLPSMYNASEQTRRKSWNTSFNDRPSYETACSRTHPSRGPCGPKRNARPARSPDDATRPETPLPAT